MIIATWNINGIRARLERLTEWLAARKPDVVCLQEIKTEEGRFPFADLEDVGYYAAVYGQKAYNGVAILAREELQGVERGFNDGDQEDPQARLIAATIEGIRIVSAYFPNGKEVGCEKYAYKLQWMQRLRNKLTLSGASEQFWAICGDFNVAPEDNDVHDPALWHGKILCSSQERDALTAIRRTGFSDAFRHVRPNESAFTWWDYRMLAFPKNHGLRIDHIYVTESVRARVLDAEVDREARKGKQASDHAPVLVTVDVAASGVP